MATVDPCNCVGAWTGIHSPACPRGGGFPAPLHGVEPTPPATAEMPECVKMLVWYIEAGDNSKDKVLMRLERLAAAVRDHYAKGKA